MDRVKQRPVSFQAGVGASALGRQLRAHRRSIERRSLRRSIFDQQRANLEPLQAVPEDAVADTVMPASVRVPRLSRREMLKRWKEEKALKRKLEAEKRAAKPVFKVCHVEPISCFPPVVSLRRRPLVSVSSDVEKRVTRAAAAAATARANAAAAPAAALKGRPGSSRNVAVPELKKHQTKVTKTAPKSVTKAEISFAPKNFEFIAPAGLDDYSNRPPLSPESADSFLMPCRRPQSPPPVIPSQLNENEAQCMQATDNQVGLVHEANDAVLVGEAGARPLLCLDGGSDLPLGVPYFRNLLLSNTTRLRHLCDEWTLVVDTENILSDNVVGLIRCVVGKANLLIEERFNQFSKLVDDCEFSRGDKVVNCTDLQGFWEMIFHQVVECFEKFEKLTRIRSNGFVDEETPIKVLTRPKRGPKAVGLKSASNNSKASDGERNRAARQRLADFKKAAAAELKKVRENPPVDELLPIITGLPTGAKKTSLCRTVLQRNLVDDVTAGAKDADETGSNRGNSRRLAEVFSSLGDTNRFEEIQISGGLSPLGPLNIVKHASSQNIMPQAVTAVSPKLNRRSDLIRFSDVFSTSDDKENCGQNPLAKYIVAAVSKE